MIEVVEPGMLTSIQTAHGRAGWRQVGVPVGGAADPWSARLANRLVGNPDDAALLELTIDGPELRFRVATAVALAGSRFDATLDGVPLSPFVGRRVRAGSALRIGSGDGARGYLAISGGLEVQAVLGSAATDLATGFGGHDGRPLRAGDLLPIGNPFGTLLRWTGHAATGPIRIVTGPHHEWLDPEVLARDGWVVGTEADRSGVRLDGRALSGDGPAVASMALPIGAVQVPPDGRPIVMLADRPVTGGYPVPACVVRADIDRVAALRTGDRVTFAVVSMREARDALQEMEEQLAALEGAGTPQDDELGWAGALD